MRRPTGQIHCAALGALAAAALACAPPTSEAPLVIAVSFDETMSAAPLDGRVLLLLSTDDAQEPRLQVGAGVAAIQIYGVDVEALAPGEEA